MAHPEEISKIAAVQRKVPGPPKTPLLSCCPSSHAQPAACAECMLAQPTPAPMCTPGPDLGQTLDAPAHAMTIRLPGERGEGRDG